MPKSLLPSRLMTVKRLIVSVKMAINAAFTKAMLKALATKATSSRISFTLERTSGSEEMSSNILLAVSTPRPSISTVRKLMEF